MVTPSNYYADLNYNKHKFDILSSYTNLISLRVTPYNESSYASTLMLNMNLINSTVTLFLFSCFYKLKSYTNLISLRIIPTNYYVDAY